jgi:RNA-directed DNA polymerase
VKGVIQGFFNYHAVPGNAEALETFRRETTRAWLFAMRRRSQRYRMPWECFWRLVRGWIPRVRILHPHSTGRFFAFCTLGKSR